MTTTDEAAALDSGWDRISSPPLARHCPLCGTAMLVHEHCISHPIPKGRDCLLTYYSFGAEPSVLETISKWNDRLRAEVEAERRGYARGCLDERDRLLAERRDVAAAVAEERERCAKVAASAVCALSQWRTTIMVRFDGIVDFEQWRSLNKSFDRAINTPAAIREGNHEHDNG